MRKSFIRPGVGALSLVLSVLAVGPAVAQGNNKVAAEALFDEGRKLMSSGHADQACAKFADSQRLDPAVGTLLNLANCYEVTGRTASAWAAYKQGASAASAAGRTSDLQVAQKRAAALAPKLSKLTIVIASGVEGMEVKRDGAVVDRAELGVGIPIDPGSHKIEASAPKKKPWSSMVDVGKDAAAVSITVPQLESAPDEPAPPIAPPPPATSATTPPPATTTPPPPEPPPSGGASTQKTVGLVVAGVGVVGLVIGTIFAVTAKNRYNTSVGHCSPNDKNSCDATGISERNDARSAGNIATVGVGVGAVALIAGGALFFTAGSDPPKSGLQILPTLGGAVARGSF